MDTKSIATALLGLVFIAIVVMSAVGIWRLVRLKASGREVEPFAPRRPVPWGLLDLFIVGVIYVVLQTIAAFVCLGPDMVDSGEMTELGIDAQIPMMVGFAVSSLLTFVIATAALRLRTRASMEDLGLSLHRLLPDLQSALMVFSLMILPILGIQWLLQLISDEPSHPVVQMLLESSSPAFFLACVLATVVAAPIVEEFLFRVLLQGWLENLALGGPFTSKETQRFLAGGRWPSDSEAAEPQEIVDDKTVPVSDNPYASPEPIKEVSSSLVRSTEWTASGEPIRKPRPKVWPIVVSSLLFALMHLGHGYDPIPLFFFALGLGWLYQRTHRMWPCVLVHMMLNGLSMLQLYLHLQAGTFESIPVP